jgi:hypothetical protein
VQLRSSASKPSLLNSLAAGPLSRWETSIGEREAMESVKMMPATARKTEYKKMGREQEEEEFDEEEWALRVEAQSLRRRKGERYVFTCALFASLNAILLGYGQSAASSPTAISRSVFPRMMMMDSKTCSTARAIVSCAVIRLLIRTCKKIRAGARNQSPVIGGNVWHRRVATPGPRVVASR